MNWNKIINIFIVLFLIVNIAMFSINYYKTQQKYTLSDTRLEQLRDILYENGYALYTHVPQNFPMKKLVLETPNIDNEAIAAAMFKDEEFTRTYRNDYDQYLSENQEVEFLKGNQKGKINYKGTNELYIPKSFTREEVERVGEKFARDFTLGIPELKLTSVVKFNEYYQLEYNEVYKGQMLFCSYVSMKVTKDGVESASTMRYAPIEYVGSKESIYPIDEILYNFMESIKPQEGELFSIKSIDLGYDLGINNLENNQSAQAVPYYRIKLDSNDTYYYVNAYTNELKKNSD